MSTIRIFSLSALFCASCGIHPASAWDYTTANPCDMPVEHRPDASVHASPQLQPESMQELSATVDLRQPLSSHIDTRDYNADLSRSEVDTGTALIGRNETYLNVLGNDVSPPAASESVGCR